MKAKALIRFNAYNFTAEAGDVIEFEREQDAKHLLSLGWVEVVNEGKSRAASKKKNEPTA
jgi:hypothetical protein